MVDAIERDAMMTSVPIVALTIGQKRGNPAHCPKRSEPFRIFPNGSRWLVATGGSVILPKIIAIHDLYFFMYMFLFTSYWLYRMRFSHSRMDGPIQRFADAASRRSYH